MARIVIVPFLPAPRRFVAMVLLPNLIFVRRGTEVTVALISHELVHIDQIRRYGLIGYWTKYLWHLARLGYQRHPFEIQAHEHAHEHLEEAAALIKRHATKP